MCSLMRHIFFLTCLVYFQAVVALTLSSPLTHHGHFTMRNEVPKDSFSTAMLKKAPAAMVLTAIFTTFFIFIYDLLGAVPIGHSIRRPFAGVRKVAGFLAGAGQAALTAAGASGVLFCAAWVYFFFVWSSFRFGAALAREVNEFAGDATTVCAVIRIVYEVFVKEFAMAQLES